ncbi:DUF6198 family protein [uncultured Sutterella sp.]|mgnify:CR=1 FL=1|uniref:YczE/YyaS/YitT family protein n=1 Tax=uncultured Sutterella sp. TaxID=286133 RepID=UPI0025FC5103|nr:DUF6198 family protein [uncultured Sutterella sp.]
MTRLTTSSGRFLHLGRRIAMLILGMELATLGISFTTCSNLGTTPISTLPYVLSKIFPLSFGTTTFILNVGFVALQWVLLRNRFSILNLLQIPGVLVFSAFIDLNMHLVRPWSPDGWWLGMAMSMLGNVVLACGIFLQIRSKTIVQPGEGIVIAFAAVLRRPFGNVKIASDLTLVTLAAVLSVSVLGGLVGLREGTAVSAVLVGLFVKAIACFFPDRHAGEPHQVRLAK